MSGTTRMSALPGDFGLDLLRARRLEADGVVERQRAVEQPAGDLAAIGHLAQRRRVHRRGNLRVDRLDRRQDRDLGLRDVQHVRQLDRVLHDVDLVLQRRLDVDRRVGHQQRARIGRHVEDEDVADAPGGAQPARRRHHRGQHFVGVQAALHQGRHLALARHLHRPRRSLVAVLGGDDRRCPRGPLPAAAATARIFASGPTSTGMIRPRRAASSAPSSESRSHGCTTAHRTGRQSLAAMQHPRERRRCAAGPSPASPRRSS